MHRPPRKSPARRFCSRAPTEVPASLQAAHPELGEQSFGVQRARSENGEPIQLAVTYVPEAVAKRYNLRRGGGLEKLAKDVRGVQQVTTAVAADAIASKQLEGGDRCAAAAHSGRAVGRERRPARRG